MSNDTCPPDIQRHLENYRDNRIPVGGFLESVLSRDLYLAVQRADPQNRQALLGIIYFLWSDMPNECYGTPEKYKAWIENRPLPRPGSPLPTYCPPDIKERIGAYVQQGVPPGGFLEAVLAHDLFEAFGRADENNIAAMFGIVSYIYNDVPSTCHGSYDRVRSWIEQHEQARIASETNQPPPFQ
jgi:hypothetical protein